MNRSRIGVAAMARDAAASLERIEEMERLGIGTAWLTTGRGGPDALTLFGAAAARTPRISLGTCIVPTWPRHPITTVQQVQVIASLAPGRLRLGLGPSHKPTMEGMYGYRFRTPLTNLREYVHIVRALLREGFVDYDGEHWSAHIRLARPVGDIPVLASALRPGSYEFCGAETDGAISWVSPYVYLRDVALPAMRRGAERAGRKTPPLIAHAPVSVHDDKEEVWAVARQQLEVYPRLPFYARMFAEAGYPEALETAAWSEGMLDAVVITGNESEVKRRVHEILGWGIGELILDIVPAGKDRQASRERTMRLLAELAKEV